MEKKENKDSISINDLTNRWRGLFSQMADLEGTPGVGTVVDKWNKLNPFLQNQRLKNLYTRAKTYSKVDIGGFLESPGNHEVELRSLAWANSSSQQIYYNILRKACDIPIYNYFIIPELLDGKKSYLDPSFKEEDGLLQNWLEAFNVKNTFKTIALEVKREGKSSYLLRNKFSGVGKSKKTDFCTLQKMPTDWVKISGKGRLGYTISFNMMYFMNIANNPGDFGDFMVSAWEDMVNTGVVRRAGESEGNGFLFDVEKASKYNFLYNNVNYGSTMEILRNKGGKISYLFWLKMPFDICYTFGSDNSHPWVAPDTMGLMLKLQELTDYGQLAGLIASTPLTAVLTGEIETISQPRAGKNESVFSPETLKNYMEQFNDATSTNVEAWLWPAKNIKLQQLASDVNSSEIISSATENFLVSGGESGLTISTEKPNIGQIVVAKQLAASQQNYVTLQLENVLNYIVNEKLGFKYHWTIKVWGDIFNVNDEKKYLKEIVAGGNWALLPKLMSGEGISMRDTEAISDYLNSLDFYKDFKTYTQISQQNIAASQDAQENDTGESEGAGRPSMDDEDIENDATAASKDSGTNRSDNRS